MGCDDGVRGKGKMRFDAVRERKGVGLREKTGSELKGGVGWEGRVG